jgi:hypothetical protein
MACKLPRQRWRSRQRWQCVFCNLQILKGSVGFESHPLRHIKTLAKTSISLELPSSSGNIGQGQTADRVLLHLDTARAGEHLVNRRLAYVALSRGRYDTQVYTNDKAQLGEALSREFSHRSAIEPDHRPERAAQKIERSSSRGLAVQQTIAHGNQH